MTTTCAIYIRKSREDKDRPAHRLTVQREQLPAHARAQGWAVEVYDDGHASAAKGKAEDLRERGRLEADVRAGKIQVILCIELSRLSRDETLADYLAWLNLCAAHKVKLATPSRILDPSQTSDWMLLLMEGGFSSVEMKVLQARMKEGREEALRAGKWISGNPPLGYRCDRGGLVIDTARQPTVERLFALAETNSARAIATELDLPFIAVRRAIADDRLLIYQGKRRLGEEIIDGQWPPLLDPTRAERIRANRRHGHGGYVKREHAGLLSNLGQFLLCGYCGRSMRSQHGRTRKSDGGRPDYYACQDHQRRRCDKSRFVQQQTLDERIITNLFGTLEHVDELRTFWLAAQNTDDSGGQIRKLDQRINEQLAKKQRLITAVTDGLFDFAEARNKKTEIDSALADLANQRAQLITTQQTPPDWDAITLTRDEFAWLTELEQRQFITAAIRHVRVFPTYALIDYRFPRDSEGTTTARIHLPPTTKKKEPQA